MTQNPDLILASGSAARQSMLRNTGISFDVHPADLDEDRIIQKSVKNGETIETITQNLANAKALAISEQNPDMYVIGSDQTLEFNGDILSKAKDTDEAFNKLKNLNGQTHRLISSVTVTKSAEIQFTATDSATLKMHDLSEKQLQTYMTADPDALTSCVGAYKIEGAGAWLFSEINGNHFTIMGMPLLPLLGFLREKGFHHE